MNDLNVVLVEPDIHWNTGNAGRTCLATGSQLHLVEPLGFSLDERQVKRAGLDYWPHVEPRVWSSWGELEPALDQLGSPWFLSAEAERSLWGVDLTGPTCLVFGAEVRGLSSDLRSRYHDRLVALPMVSDRVRSLNLSSCVAICLYEALRQRRFHRGSP